MSLLNNPLAAHKPDLPHDFGRTSHCETCEGPCWYTWAIRNAGGSPDALWMIQAVWSVQTFGADSVRGPNGSLDHIIKECREAKRSGKIDEFADIVILAWDAARRAGYNLPQLMKAVAIKLAINLGREWPPPSTDKPVEHVEPIETEKLLEIGFGREFPNDVALDIRTEKWIVYFDTRYGDFSLIYRTSRNDNNKITRIAMSGMGEVKDFLTGLGIEVKE